MQKRVRTVGRFYRSVRFRYFDTVHPVKCQQINRPISGKFFFCPVVLLNFSKQSQSTKRHSTEY